MTTMNKSFYITVSHVDMDGQFMKIYGRIEQNCLQLRNTLFHETERFNSGVGIASPAALINGVICVAKIGDNYFRAKVIDASNRDGTVKVSFIDYGNESVVSCKDIRTLGSYPSIITSLPPQACEYILARFINVSGRWDDSKRQTIFFPLTAHQRPIVVEANLGNIQLISVDYDGIDFAEHLCQLEFGVSIPVEKQIEMLMQKDSTESLVMKTKWQNKYAEPPPISGEHVTYRASPPQISTNPRSLQMRLQQPPGMILNRGTFTAPNRSMLLNQSATDKGQKSITPKYSRSSLNIKSERQTFDGEAPAAESEERTVPNNRQLPSPKKSPSTFKSRLLEVNTYHNIYVSYADEGPGIFAVQLYSDSAQLTAMSEEINRLPVHSLAEPPEMGSICLGRFPTDNTIGRAIVMGICMDHCTLYFVDFGDTLMVSYYNVYRIPEQFVKPNIFALRFCLAGVKVLERSKETIEDFKRLVSVRGLVLKVVKAEGVPLLQYGEILSNGRSVLEMLKELEAARNSRIPEPLALGLESSVIALVSYVDSCDKFFIQLVSSSDALESVMSAVDSHCATAPPLDTSRVRVGLACCALFPDDEKWYRATILAVNLPKATISYVDYGNEQEVEVSHLRSITQELASLPAQAIACALTGYENRPVENKYSNQLEMLTLEKTMQVTVFAVLSDGRLVVDLVRIEDKPPLNITKAMMDLAQPRNATKSSHTASRPSPPASEGSQVSSPEDDRRKSKSSIPEKEVASGDKGRSSDRSKPDRAGKPHDDFKSKSIANDTWDETPRTAGGFKPRNSGDDRGARRPRDTETSAQDSWEEPSASAPRGGGVERRSKPWEERPQSSEASSSGRRFGNRDSNWGKPDRRNPKPYAQRDDSIRQGDRQRGENRQPRNARDKSSKKERQSVNERLAAVETEQSWNEPRTSNKKDSADFSNRRANGKDNWSPKKNDLGDGSDSRKGSWREKNTDWGDNENKPSRSFAPREERPFKKRDNSNTDKSWDSARSDTSERRRRFEPRNTLPQVSSKEISNPVPLNTPFPNQDIGPDTQFEVSITWFITPESFFVQVVSLQGTFVDMMNKIPELYRGVKPYKGEVAVGNSVLAKFPDDGVLYRATVLSVLPSDKYIVQYVDFGNKYIVSSKDIWQLSEELMTLPVMGVQCTLDGIKAPDEDWNTGKEMDACFVAPRHQCIFHERQEDKYRVSLWNKSVSVAQILIERNIAVPSDHQATVPLKDEPIDLKIVVGQELVSRISHVESINKFYIQLDPEKVDAVEKSIMEYDTTKLQPLAVESLVSGTHCVVQLDDRIHRAIISDITDSDVVVQLPDSGRQIIATSDKFMMLPSELSVYYYQSLECRLNNYTDESTKLMSHEEFVEKLMGNKFIVYINDIEELRLLVTIYDRSSGKKLDIFEPDEGALDVVSILTSIPVYNDHFGPVFISHVNSLNEIYIQRDCDSNILAELLENLFEFYEGDEAETPLTYEVDSYYATKSTDGNWYRGKIVSVTETHCDIQFIDYGNSENIEKTNIKILNSKFYETHILALVISLQLVALQEDTVPKFVEMTAEKELQVTVAASDEGWLARLNLNGIDVSNQLCQDKLAVPPQNIGSEIEMQNIDYSKSTPAECTQVYISHIDSPGQFWLQMSSDVSKIDELQAELQNNANSYNNLETRDIGTLCVAKYSADDQWYRAQILDLDSDIITVRFIDYGNTDVLDNLPDALKDLPESMKNIDGYILKSSVNATPSGTGQWTEAASDFFVELMGDTSNPVDALVVLRDIMTYVDLFVNGENITDKLVASGHATKSEKVECGILPSCFASHINSPSEFWIQLESSIPELQAVDLAMESAENFSELTEMEEGIICAAKYLEDNCWYRAQIIVQGSDGTEVLFMDYGNASLTTELRSLPEELKSKPALSRKCALQRPQSMKSWDPKLELKFNELAAEGATIFTVQFIASGDISIVDLYLDGKSVTELLLDMNEIQPEESISCETTPLSATVSHINSPCDFYVRLIEFEKQLEEVSNSLVEASEFELPEELIIDSLCVAMSPKDQNWYRAKILDFSENGVSLYFIDHGIKMICEEVRKIPEDLSKIQPLVKHCTLVKENEEYNEHATQKFTEISNNSKTQFRIEFLDTNNELNKVRLFMNDLDVTTLLVSEIEKLSKQDTLSMTDENIINSQDDEVNKEEVNKVVVLNKETLEPTFDINEKIDNCMIDDKIELEKFTENKNYNDDDFSIIQNKLVSKESSDDIVNSDDKTLSEREEAKAPNTEKHTMEDTVENAEKEILQSESTIPKHVTSCNEVIAKNNLIEGELESSAVISKELTDVENVSIVHVDKSKTIIDPVPDEQTVSQTSVEESSKEPIITEEKIDTEKLVEKSINLKMESMAIVEDLKVEQGEEQIHVKNIEGVILKGELNQSDELISDLGSESVCNKDQDDPKTVISPTEKGDE